MIKDDAHLFNNAGIFIFPHWNNVGRVFRKACGMTFHGKTPESLVTTTNCSLIVMSLSFNRFFFVEEKLVFIVQINHLYKCILRQTTFWLRKLACATVRKDCKLCWIFLNHSNCWSDWASSFACYFWSLLDIFQYLYLTPLHKKEASFTCLLVENSQKNDTRLDTLRY